MKLAATSWGKGLEGGGQTKTEAQSQRERGRDRGRESQREGGLRV